jgi:uncharacterized repeat protein (TIGR03806 family)
MTTIKRLRAFGAAILLASLAGPLGCADDGAGEPSGPTIVQSELPYARLSEYGFFVGDPAELTPAPGVFEYTVNAPLFADNSSKGRFLWLPEGEQITLTEQDEWDLPTGAIVIKTFFFDTGAGYRVIETRLLERKADGNWHSHIYQWDEAQTDATYVRAGADVTVTVTGPDGGEQEQLYLVPDENACGSCHERDDTLRLLGVTTHQLNTTVERDGVSVNQLTWLAEQGVIAGAAPDPAALPAFPDPYGDADLEARARAYLHGNCSHCHRPGGGGGASGLSFLAWETQSISTGVCKVPAAAGPGAGGRPLDIVPGRPEDSIVVFRMASTDPEIKMPEVPTLLSDADGVALITEWIASMPPNDCGLAGE